MLSKDNENLLLFTDCHVIPNPYAVIFSVEQTYGCFFVFV